MSAAPADFARAPATYYGGLEAPEPLRGRLFLSSWGIQFVWGTKQDERQLVIPRDRIGGIETSTDRSTNPFAVLLFGVIGLLASDPTAGLIVETTDDRVAAFGVHGVTSAQLVGGAVEVRPLPEDRGEDRIAALPWSSRSRPVRTSRFRRSARRSPGSRPCP